MMAQAKFCEFCGEPLLAGDSFCGSCGRELSGEQGGSGFTLVIIDGQSTGQIIPLNPGEFILGRGAQADLKLEDLAVSRQHVQLSVQSGGLTVKDLGTSNGTLVNGAQLLGMKRLKPGDTIQVGQTVLKLHQTVAQPAPAPMKSPKPSRVQTPNPPKVTKKRRSRVTTLLIGAVLVVVCALAAVIVVGRSAITAWFDSSSAGSSNGMVAVQLINQAAEDVCFVHISPSSDDQWGADWLGEQETIPPGGTRSFSLQPALVFDWVALNCGQEILEEGYQLVAEPGLQLNVRP